MTVLSQALIDNYIKTARHDINTELLNKVFTLFPLKVNVTRNRAIDGRIGCGAGYRVTLANTETGYKFTTSFNNSRANGERKPDVNDIISCLLSDRSCYNSCVNFNDFCNMLGYEQYQEDRYGFLKENTKAKRAFAGCRRTAENFENLLNSEQLEQLDELYQDF